MVESSLQKQHVVNVIQELVFVILTDKLKVSVDKDSEDVFLACITTQ